VSVAGMVMNELQQPLTGVTVELDGSEFIDEITDESGTFSFPEMISGGSYDLHPTLNNNFSNGVSTLDLIHVQKHLLGLKTIDSPYKMIAADVNNDQKISASDLLDSRELILGVSQSYTNNTSWRFIKANYEFQNEANPLTESYPESDQINNIQEDINTQFIAIKVGDITNDASLNGLPVVEPRNNNTLQLDLDAVQLNSNQVEIPVYANDFNQINGFQFTLNYDRSALVFTGIASGAINLGVNNYNETQDGNVAVSWSKALALDITDDVELFRIRFDVKKVSELQNVLSISSDLTRAEAYDADLNKMNLELNFRNLEKAGEFTLYQNSPNPFSESTVISFFMKEAGVATISIYDLNGKVLKVMEGDFNMGTNAITVTKSDLPVNGMLYYQLNTDNFSATKKMIFVK